MTFVGLLSGKKKTPVMSVEEMLSRLEKCSLPSSNLHPGSQAYGLAARSGRAPRKPTVLMLS